jgi:transposase
VISLEKSLIKLAHKAEHAVDLASGALLAVTVQPADRGDTKSYTETLNAAQQEARKSHTDGIEEAVLDKGYHSGAVLMDLAEREIRSYIPEPKRGKRHWVGKEDEQRCVYANRRRVRADRSKRLQKLRGELCERSFAHCYETGAMRRMHVRGTDNVLKRVLVQAAAFNMGLLLRKLSGWGKPRGVQGRFNSIQALLSAIFAVQALYRAVSDSLRRFESPVFSETTITR